MKDLFLLIGVLVFFVGGAVGLIALHNYLGIDDINDQIRVDAGNNMIRRACKYRSGQTIQVCIDRGHAHYGCELYQTVTCP